MRRSPLRPAGAALPLALALVTGCGASGTAQSAAGTSGAPAPAATPAGRPCGQGRTAAGVPVVVKVARGPVSCHAALRIEKAYAAAVAAGRAPGNGGGGPVRVQGWVCTGFDTPEILRTGDASRCAQGSAEVIAVLPSPSSSASP